MFSIIKKERKKK